MTAATAAAKATALAAEAATTAAAAAKTAGRALFLRTGLVDRQLTTVELRAIHLLGSQLGLIGRAHGDKRKAAWAARHPVNSDVNVRNGAKLAEMRTKSVFGCLEGEVSNV